MSRTTITTITHTSNSESLVIARTTFFKCHSATPGGAISATSFESADLQRTAFHSCSSAVSAGSINLVSNADFISLEMACFSGSVAPINPVYTLEILMGNGSLVVSYATHVHISHDTVSMNCAIEIIGGTQTIDQINATKIRLTDKTIFVMRATNDADHELMRATFYNCTDLQDSIRFGDFTSASSNYVWSAKQCNFIELHQTSLLYVIRSISKEYVIDTCVFHRCTGNVIRIDHAQTLTNCVFDKQFKLLNLAGTNYFYDANSGTQLIHPSAEDWLCIPPSSKFSIRGHRLTIRTIIVCLQGVFVFQ